MMLRSLMSNSRPQMARYEDPFALMQKVLRGIDDVWPVAASSSGVPEAAAMSMRLDVKEDEKAFHVTADLPGISEKDVEVTFDDGLLTIRGERKIERDEKKDTWHLVERSFGSFARQLSLPANIDAGKIEAKFDHGVLTVSLPKMPASETSARKIAVKAG